MIKKRMLIGSVLLIIGLFLILNFDANITGAVIGVKVSPTVNSFVGVLFVIVGVLVLEKSAIEVIVKEAPKVCISEQAIERSKKDRYVRENLKRYAAEINRIAEEPEKISQEIIGDFRISPRGHKNIRVAWHMKRRDGQEEVCVDDLLYHKGEDYVDKWNKKVSKGTTTKKSYSGYRNYKSTKLSAAA